MTFAARQHVAAAAPTTGPQALGTMSIDGTVGSSTNKIVSLTLNADGTITAVNQMTINATASVPSNWYSPTTGAVGAGYRVRFTLLSGTTWDAGLTSGTLYALSAARTITFTLLPSNSLDASVLVEITSSANTTVLGSGTLNVSLYSEY